MKLCKILVLAVMLSVLSGCAAVSTVTPNGALRIMDARGQEISFSVCPNRVVALSGSLGELWLLSGGNLVGCTEDMVKENRLTEDCQAQLVGSIKEPNLEIILSLEPDFVILAADIAAHCELKPRLEAAGIVCGLFREEFFEDYLALLTQFTELTGRDDLLQQNGYAVQSRIEAQLDSSTRAVGATALLLRSYSGGCRAKGSDTAAGKILQDFGFVNLCDGLDSELEELSMEAMLEMNPDYLFITVMGLDQQAGLDYWKDTYSSHPAWDSLSAVQSGRVYFLPQELFHYKPNARWDEAYGWVAENVINK